MFFIPEFSKNLINQLLQSYFAQRYSNFVNDNKGSRNQTCQVSGTVINCLHFPFQAEYAYIYGFQTCKLNEAIFVSDRYPYCSNSL
jgi:hypothetical protein